MAARGSTHDGPRRGARRKAALALLTVALVFVAAEGISRGWVTRAARVDGRWLNDLLTVPDAERIYALRPGVHLDGVRFERMDWRMRPCWQGEVSIAIDGRGFRGDGFRARKPAGTARVFCLGDSIVFGQEVEAEQTFVARLERALADGRDGAVEVINAGVFGYSSEQVRATLRRVLPLQPDALLVVLPANDVGTARRSDRELIAALRPGAVWLQRQLVRSRLFLVLRAALRGHTPPREGGEVMQVSHAETGENLATMADLAEGAGVPLVLVLPHHLDWPPPFHFAEHRDAHWAMARALARERGLALVELSPAFADGPPEALLVDSCHMNAAGHAVAAEALLPAVQPLLPSTGAR